jgi:hypothetical protein
MVKKKFGMKLIDRKSILRLTYLFAVLFLLGFIAWILMFWMPGKSYQGVLPELRSPELALQARLKQDVTELSDKIGPHNEFSYQSLNAARAFLKKSLSDAGYQVREQEYKIKEQSFYNLEVEKKGTERPNEIVVIGGHYDSAFTSPGANDNGTGAAATLELARIFADLSPKRTIRFVEFTNEEPPFFWTDDMGSLVYAKSLKQKNENVVAMLSLETMGYFSDKAGSQQYPSPMNLLYPNKGNFIGFVGNLGSRELLRRSIVSFRRHNAFPSEGAALPNWVPGVGWSDHWSFWQQGYPGIMVTDTATFRYPQYHTEEDTVDKIDFDRFTRVVAGLVNVIGDLAS